MPPPDLSRVAGAAFDAGAGQIGGYHDCAFFCHGIGTFRGAEGTHPTIGLPGHHEAAEEMRLEIITPRALARNVAAAVRAAHTYDEPAVDIYPLEDFGKGQGWGRIGYLAHPTTARALLNHIKKATRLKRLLLAPAGGNRAKAMAAKVTIAACCAGTCGALFGTALARGATFYLTGEMRHHHVADETAAGLTVACLGHGNSERIALPRLARRLRRQLPGAKVALARSDRDPFEIV